MTPRKSAKRSSSKNLGRKRKNVHVTKSGKSIPINRSLIERFKAYRARSAKKRAERLAGMPKSRVKRFFYRLHPKRMARYWFSREGAVMALKIAGIGAFVMIIFTAGVFAYFRKDLPNITDFSGNNIGGSIQYYDRTGEILLWEDFDAVKRIPVPGDEISDHMKNATIAIEDQEFYDHGGFDLRGISRAAINNALSNDATQQGGSTITQQLVKLTNDWTNQRTYSRKIRELILAVQLENEYDKDQILTGYLNVAPYGNIEYGVEAAANDYFHKSASEIGLAEAAFIAAIPQSPSLYSPYGPYFDKGALIGRQHHILGLMVEQGMITQEQADKAKEVDILKKVKKQRAKYTNIKAPYFALAAKDELNTRFGSDSANRGGWKVRTTLDMDLQKLAEKSVSEAVPTLNQYGANSAAFVAEDVESGQIVSLVGGVDFDNEKYGEINYASEAFIPPGSTFKPYDYAALIEYSENAGAGSVLYDEKGPLPGYPCTDKGLPPPRGTGNCLQNYDFRTPGPLTLRYALGGSRNIPAVKANLIVGTDKVIDMASKMMYNVNDMERGVSSYNCYADEKLTVKTQCYGASAIGDGAFLHLDDHVNGFATFARLGKAIPRTYILEITDASNKKLYEYRRPQGEQVIREDTAYIVNDMMADPNASYLPAGYYKFHDYNGWDFAIKTGTTNNGFDGLMASWSKKYATVAWIGHHTRNVELGGSMEQMTTPIIKPWMEGAHDKAGQATNWRKPDGVKTEDAYVVRNHVGIGSVEPSPSKDLFPSWYNPPNGGGDAKDIDKVSNKVATECTPARAIKRAGNANSNIFSVDTFVDAGSINGTGEKDDVHSCSDQKPDVIGLSVNPQPCDPDCTVSATITAGTHPLNSSEFPGTVNFIIGGDVVASKKVGGPGVVNFPFTADFNGTKTFRVEVIDSVLYEGSATGSITGEADEDDPPAITGSSEDSGEITVNWTGGVGTVTLFWEKPGNDSPLCSGSGGSCSFDESEIGPIPPSRKIYAVDAEDNESNKYSVPN